MNQAQFYCRSIKRMCNSRSLLPSQYQQVEYIAGTGAQYIITPITTRSALTFDFTFQRTGDSGQYAAFGGQDANNNNCVKYYVTKNLENTWRYGSVSSVYPQILDNNKHTIHATPTGISADNGTIYQCIPSAFTSNIQIYIFSINGTTHMPNFAGYVYRFTITENNAKIFDAVPCYRIADNVRGMLDIVTSAFFSNAGSGEFTSGNNI